MSSLFAQLMAPGGGVTLVPFTRGVCCCLFATTMTVFILGVARIHMGILSFLSAGMWVSLGVFQKEYELVMQSRAADIPKKAQGPSGSAPAISDSKRED